MPSNRSWSVAVVGVLATIVLAHGGGASASIPAPRESVAVSNRKPSSFWLLADPQLHNAAGTGTRAKSWIPDALAKVAIRPPTLDLWAEVVLAKIIKTISATYPVGPVFFLGDAADVSCGGEFARFLQLMHPLPWLGVLGNHDGYYMGNMTFSADGENGARRNRWQGACEHSAVPNQRREALVQLERLLLEDIDGEGGLTHVEQGTLTKTHGVWMYMQDLAIRLGMNSHATDPQNWLPTRDGRWYRYVLQRELTALGTKLKVSARALVAKVGRGEDTKAWQASVVQDVELADGTHVLLLDTADYTKIPPSRVFRQLLDLVRGFLRPCDELFDTLLFPGKCGEVGPAQIAEILEMRDGWPPGTRFFVMGHHPWSSLNRSTRRRLPEVLAHPGFAGYFSGHTHMPASIRGKDGEPGWELNIGSTTDWPMEYARVRYEAAQPIEDGTEMQVEVFYARAEMRCPYANADAESDELDYRSSGKYTELALGAYDRLFSAAVQDEPERREQLQALLQQIRALNARYQELRAELDRPTQRQGVDRRRYQLQDLLERNHVAQRKLLAQLISHDRTKLRDSSWVREIETACAIWASFIECKKNNCAGRSLRPSFQSHGRDFPLRVPAKLFQKPSPSVRPPAHSPPERL